MSSNAFAELSNLHFVDRSSLCIYIITSFPVGNSVLLRKSLLLPFDAPLLSLHSCSQWDTGNLCLFPSCSPSFPPLVKDEFHM
jgi:hypothetical protein